MQTSSAMGNNIVISQYKERLYNVFVGDLCASTLTKVEVKALVSALLYNNQDSPAMKWLKKR